MTGEKFTFALDTFADSPQTFSERREKKKLKLKAKKEMEEKTFFQFHSTDDDARVRSSSSRQGFTFEF